MKCRQSVKGNKPLPFGMNVISFPSVLKKSGLYPCWPALGRRVAIHSWVKRDVAVLISDYVVVYRHLLWLGVSSVCWMMLEMAVLAPISEWRVPVSWHWAHFNRTSRSDFACRSISHAGSLSRNFRNSPRLSGCTALPVGYFERDREPAFVL